MAGLGCVALVEVGDPVRDLSPRVVLACVAAGVYAALGAFGVIVDRGDHRVGERRFVVGWHEPAVGFVRA